MRYRTIKTGKEWETSGEKAQQIASQPDIYEIISMTPEEEEIIKIEKPEPVKTDEELFLADEQENE